MQKFYLSFSKRLILFIILFICFFGLGILLFVNSMNVVRFEDVIYNSKGDVNYTVCLKDNDFYDQKCLNRNMSYVADLIDKISLSFDYDFSINKDVSADFSYDVMGKLVISNSDNPSDFYAKTYVLKNKTDFKNYSFKDNLDIDYGYYNDIASKFKSQYGVNTESYLEVYLNIYDNLSATYYVPSSFNASVIIPLSLKSIQIKTDSSGLNKSQSLSKESSKFDISNGVCLVFSVLSFILSICFMVKFLKMTLLLKKKNTKYDKYLDKILKEYDRLIVSTLSLPKFEDYNVLKIVNFEELIDVRDNLKEPIMYFNVVSHQKAYFYILHGENLYLFTLKSVSLENNNEKI